MDVRYSGVRVASDRRKTKTEREIMKTTLLRVLWLNCLLLLLVGVFPAQAFYNPTSGRWLSRDPIEEKDGANVHGFAAGNPIGNADRDGRSIFPVNLPGEIPWPTIPNSFPWPGSPTRPTKPPINLPSLIDLICPFKCGGVAYNPRTHCCLDGVATSKASIDTGVATHKWTGAPDASGNTPVHYWLTWDGGSADANSYALVLQPGDGRVQSPAGQTPAPNTRDKLKLSPCAYDFKKLNACLAREASALAASGINFGMCWKLPPHLIDTCKAESKR
jgi:hypothetical protein